MVERKTHWNCYSIFIFHDIIQLGLPAKVHWESWLSFFSTVSKITLICSLESSFRNTWKPLPLLVKIIHKSRLRYYGKLGLKIDYPYQVSHSAFWATVKRYSQDLTSIFLFTLSLVMQLTCVSPTALPYFRHTLKLLTRVASCLLCFGTNFVQSFTRGWM